MRNRHLAPRRTCRRSDRRFYLTQDTQPQARKEPHHEQDETHRGFRRIRIRRSRNGRTGRTHGRRRDSTPPPSPPPPQLADAAAATSASALVGTSAAAPAATATPAETRLALVSKKLAVNARHVVQWRAFSFFSDKPCPVQNLATGQFHPLFRISVRQWLFRRKRRGL